MEKRTIKISLEIAKEWYKGDNEMLKHLALQAFKEHELQDITRVRSWEEFCKKYNVRDNEYYIDDFSNIKNVNINSTSIRKINNDKNILASEKDAESFLALMQLKRLRDQWWEALNWKPDYTDDFTTNYAIVVVLKNEITTTAIYTVCRILSFPNREIAEDFLNCFKDLIEKAKELI